MSFHQQPETQMPFDRNLLSSEDGKITAIKGVIEKGLAASAGGLYGASMSFVIAQIAYGLPGSFFVIAPGVDSAELIYDDLTTFLGYDIPVLFPMHETFSHSDAMSPSYTERLNVLLKVQKNASQKIIVSSVGALLQDVPPPELIEENSFALSKGERLDIDKLLEALSEKKFTRSAMVEMPGEFAMRGGIVDIYPFSLKYPLRMELAGDIIESMRFFEVSTQISIEKVESVSLPLLSQNEFFQARHLTSSLLNYLSGYGIFVIEAAETFRRAHSFLDTLYSSPDHTNKVVAGFMKRLENFPQVSLSSLPAEEKDNSFRFHTASAPKFSGDLKNIFAELKSIADETREVRVFCHSGLEQKRFEGLAAESETDFKGRLRYSTGFLSKGFRMADYKIAMIPYGEIFGRYRHLRPAKETADYRSEGFYEFEKGDYVVHLQNGIGKFLGVRTLKKDGRSQDHLVLEFQDGVKLYVPVSQADLVEKFVGSGDAKPELSSIGTDEWDNKKRRVQLAVNN
ncbi:MAG: hypothetical protein HZA48_09525, partial [Planctomycetes bacterium]|nr:hypothetical protein [Planctomycetota bacterium]